MIISYYNSSQLGILNAYHEDRAGRIPIDTSKIYYEVLQYPCLRPTLI
jgi:hypothetical protein